MKIKTITCHDVYNAGASLQAYALMKYLQSLGHEAEIIDYKPDYLSKHYSFSAVCNTRYEENIVLKIAYLVLKFPGRLQAYLGKRKKNYDYFRKNYLKLTPIRYSSNEELQAKLPEADVYIAGSDQIWNPIFKNGRDPAFYLSFAPADKVKASYAASFSADKIPDECKADMKANIERLDYISVREKSGLSILEELQIDRGVCVLDPVFLLPEREWEMLAGEWEEKEKYILVYDFDNSSLIEEIVTDLAVKNEYKIYSILKSAYAHKSFYNEGPLGFLQLLKNAEYIVANSFHALAFALIFRKQFIIVKREENLNARIEDLLQLAGLGERMISDVSQAEKLSPIEYEKVWEKISKALENSKEYIATILKGDN